MDEMTAENAAELLLGGFIGASNEAEAQRAEIARLREVMVGAERLLNVTRDTMIEDREHYDGLIGFAGDVEAAAHALRSALAPTVS